MRITNKSNKINKNFIQLFEKILSSLNDLNEKFVDEIIICNENDLEGCVKEIDENISMTKLYGCNVKAKTITINKKSKILLSANILEKLETDVSISDGGKFVFGIDSIESLKTIYHEFGHAKNALINGNIKVKKEVKNSVECLYELWKILRNEYIAEKYSANICKIETQLDWYGEFNDSEEINNFYSYLLQHVNNEGLINENFILQFLLFYYFLPLFKKAGFLDGLKKFINIENIPVCKTINKIRECQVINNVSVTQQFNDIVLEKWEDLQIKKILDQLLRKSSC